MTVQNNKCPVPIGTRHLYIMIYQYCDISGETRFDVTFIDK